MIYPFKVHWVYISNELLQLPVG